YTHRREHKRLVDEVYGYFPRLFERKDQLAGTLSGGEQQMLAVGRAYMSEPSVMLLDEPSLGLLPQMTAQVMAVLGKLRRDRALAARASRHSGAECGLEGAPHALGDDPMVRHLGVGGTASTDPIAPSVDAALAKELPDET